MIDLSRVRFLLSMFGGVPAGALYGLLMRLLMGSPETREVFGLMTVGFIFVVPFFLGVIAVSAAPPHVRRSWGYGIVASLISCCCFLVLMGVFALEVVICLIMLAPASLALALAGGLLSTAVARVLTRPERQQQMALLFAFAPLLVTPVEAQFPPADSYRVVAVRQHINADAAQVWHQITHFDPITEREHRPSLFQSLGMPRPVTATLMGSGLGVVRRGLYENGLTFREIVTDWQPERTFAFTIALDPDVPPPAPYNGIGGRHLELRSARYTIEPVGDGTVFLVLESEHRLSTRFNEYGGAWTDLILSDLQQYLLRIVKERAEAA